MRPIDEKMVSFLRVLREKSFELSPNGLASFSRNDLTRLYRESFGETEDVSEVLDMLAFNRMIDAESKSRPTFEGFFITEEGIEFLRRPDQFEVIDGDINRRKVAKVDATAWTGKRLILTDERVIRDLRIKVSELRDKVLTMRIESNSDSQDIKALVEALVDLCEMAAPDLGLIERILSHPKFKLSAKLVAGVAGVRGAIGI